MFDGTVFIKELSKKDICQQLQELQQIEFENRKREEVITMNKLDLGLHELEQKEKENSIAIKASSPLLVGIALCSLIIGIVIGSMFTTIQYLHNVNTYADHIVQLPVSSIEEDNIMFATEEVVNIGFSRSLLDRELEIQELQATIESKNNEILALTENINEVQEELNIFKERSELYDKYEIAVMNTNNTRTELTYDEIKYTEELALSKNIPPELVFYMAKLESNFNPKLSSNYSSARGLVQVIKGTGEWIHTALMGKDKSTYNHDDMFITKNNIEYAVTYMDYLFDKSNGSVYEMLKRYSGGYSSQGIGDRYHNLIEGHMFKFGYSMNQAQQDYNKLNNL